MTAITYNNSIEVDMDDSLSPTCFEKRRKPMKEVSFSIETDFVECAHSPISEETVQLLWWSRDEMSRLRQSARELSTTIRENSDSQACPLVSAYKKTTLMLRNDLEALVKLSPTTPEQDLFRHCCKMDGRRGLERYTSKTYAANRHQDIVDYRNAVFQEQQRQRDDMNGSYLDEQLIAKVARESSRRARSFAVFLGETDSLISRAQVADRKPRRSAPRRSRTVSLTSRSHSSRSLSSGSIRTATQ